MVHFLTWRSCVFQDEEDVYGEEAKGEDDADEEEDEGEDAGVQGTLRANVNNNSNIKLCESRLYLRQITKCVYIFQSLHVGSHACLSKSASFRYNDYFSDLGRLDSIHLPPSKILRIFPS